MDTPLRRFLEIPYEQLEEVNLQAKAERVAGEDPGEIREARVKRLTDEKGIKAVSIGAPADIDAALATLNA